MRKLTAADVETRSLDLVTENIEQLRAIFPEAFTEGKIDFAVLRQLLSKGAELLDGSEEKYGLNWHGKRQARQLALTPSIGTLRPSPADSVDWDTTQNLMIEGDNLEVLKLLQKSYAGKVKLIYIDPPYNTGNDLLYPNAYQDGIRTYLEVTGQIEGGATLSSNTEAGGRYHTNWLNMMYPRLLLARRLLTGDGVLICTIDENEMTNLGCLLKDVFEEGSFEHVAVTIVHNPRGVQGSNFSYTHEYAFFVFPRDTKAIADRRLASDEITWSQFRNWGTESERSDARNCFYAVHVKGGEVIGFGDVCPDEFHPRQTEMDGDVAFVYPIDSGGVERKWRYARQSVEAIKHLLRARATDTGYEIEIGKDFETYRTVWTDKRYDANKYGTQLLKALIPDSPFSFPKSIWSTYDCIQAVAGNDPDAVILDFFAGSGTTGHAIWEMNTADGGHRRFILVQLPEPIKAHSRFRTIADVTMERLRRAGQKIRAENPMFAGDTGFRVFKLDTSNIRAWEANGDDLADTIQEYAEHLKTDRSEQDILYELLLKLGLDLSTPIERRSIAGKTVHSVGAGTLLVCLAEQITRGEAEPLAEGITAWRREQAPAGESSVVFRDSAFADDVTKSNLAAILQQRGLTNVRSL